ncbi:fimbrillin family protein [Bacteroides sp. 51]|uniref:fimbrillin family protein n=1 Tax=Bacteroides sp. 51 TaxID=2302938 RepID=UPI0013CF4152|nr:fimbrillin family protein [Bacteroides sp. 51]NDV83336.1 fimbrillin family protein [Bacteroides sp. 51]
MNLILKQTKTFIANTLGIIILAGTAFSCSKSEIIEDQYTEQAPILLQSRVSAGKLRLQTDQIESNQKLGFYVTQASDINNVKYDNIAITADGSGGFSYTERMYYPADNSKVNFYAIHPYNDAALLEQNESVTFSITPDQTTANGYLQSDLLHASKSDVSRSKDKIGLEFTHRLSKFSFTIKPGNGMDLSHLNAVSILGTKPSTSIHITTGNLQEVGNNTTEVYAYGVKGASDSEAQVTGIQAIVVPQTIDADTRLFKITVGTTDYYYTTPETITYASGYNYNYELTIHSTGIDVSSSITPWINSETITGEGEAE